MTRVIAPFLFIAVSVGLFFSYIDPAYRSVQELILLRNDLDEALNNSKELKKELAERLEEYNSFAKTDLARVQKSLPDMVDNVRVIIELDTLASRHDVEMKNFTFSQNVSSSAEMAAEDGDVDQAYGVATLSFETTAQYQDFVAFLSEVETNLRISDVSSVNVTLNQGADTTAKNLKFDVTLHTYWLP